MAHCGKPHSILLGAVIVILSACRPNNQKAFQQLISIKPDTLKIDNTKDTLIIGSKGTALFFEKGSFQLPDGIAPQGKISILLIECYSNSEIVRENLTTTSGGKMLQTRGMVYINAFSNGRELKIKKGKRFIIHFPKDSSDRKTQMNLFYGKRNSDSVLDWKLDSLTLLKPAISITEVGWTGYSGGDTSNQNDNFNLKGRNKDSLYSYLYNHFDYARIGPVKTDSLNKLYKANFVVNKIGKIINIKITKEDYDSAGNTIAISNNVNPYFYKYIQQIPTVEPFYAYNSNLQLKPIDANCDIYFSIGLSAPDYNYNGEYNKIFNKKYSAFKKSIIMSMNAAELNYYIFSTSKLGWINCDYFWETKDEKIDYYVKANSTTTSQIRLIFKKAKSILAGSSEGDKYVFKNVPINQDVKIVAITFVDNKPLMAVSETKTGKTVFDKLQYKPFTIGDLEKQINSP